MKIVVMVDKADGNESVGEMWTETFIFDSSSTLKEVIDRIDPFDFDKIESLKNVRIQIAQEAKK